MPITDTKFRPQMPMAKSYIVEFNGNQYGHIAELKPGTKGKAKQEDVIGSWYAWVDIDPPPEIVADLLNLTEEERREITARFADEVCKVLEVTDLPPSCILFSGRGVWMFWRLDICLPANEIQDLNRRLEQHIEDLLEVLKVPANVDTCSNADRIARWPGSINRKTGLKAEWIHQEDHAHAYDPDDLLRHLPAPKFKTHTASNLEARFEETIDPNDGDEFEVEDLSGRVLDYFTGAATSDGSDDFQSAVTWAVSRGKSYNSVLSAFEALQNETGKADYQGELGGAGARFLAQGRLEQQLQISWMKAIDFLDRESGEFDPGSNDLGETQTGPGDDGEIVREPSPFVYCGELLNSKPPTYLVEGLILKGAVGALVGPSQTFKSFIAMNLAWSLAAGLAPYPGARAEQAEVLYIAGEGQADLPARYQAFLAHNDLHFFDVEFHALPEPRYLNDPKVVRALVNGVRRITPIEKHLFVVVDTMSANFSGKENSDEAADFIRGCQTIARECNATVMFVHHLGKDESKGPRGHTSIFANSDFVLDVKRLPGQLRSVMNITKLKSGPIDLVFDFDLVPTPVEGCGDITESLAVEANAPRKPKLGSSKKDRSARDAAAKSAINAWIDDRIAEDGRAYVKDLVRQGVDGHQLSDKNKRDFFRDAVSLRGDIHAVHDKENNNSLFAERNPNYPS